jgi:hypothetical protein
MWKEFDPVTHAIVAWRTRLQYMSPERTIWMDGRPHPDDEAPHTWEGFSTGRWEGGAFIVTTTHLKTSWLRRNGVPRSDKATVVERFTRHGNYLSVVTTVYDRSTSASRILTARWSSTPWAYGLFVCETTEEVARPRESFRTFCLAKTSADRVYGGRRRAVEAARGGAEKLYPEYRAEACDVAHSASARTGWQYAPQAPPR